MSRVVRDAANIEYRQLTVIDVNGDTAFHNGSGVLGTHGAAQGTDAVAAGNLLRDERIPAEMVGAFEANPETELGDRLIAAVSARDGAAIADPFTRSADAVEIVRRRVQQLSGTSKPRRRLAITGHSQRALSW
jgi:uncharacterized Ntn-hydrolase superfamily protein